MNKRSEILNTDKKLLSIYYTAGYPELDSTIMIANKLEQSGVDFLEIGFPYSDPVADGTVIQNSSQIALQNGMTLKVLFQQLHDIRTKVKIPIFLMGYLNPVLQYGVENFCKSCKEVGVDGVIIPDLPLYAYEEEYQDIFKKYGIHFIFLITPQTSDERIHKIDNLSTSFIYLLSSNSTTGKEIEFDLQSKEYFRRIQNMGLQSPTIVGFGISDKNSFESTTQHTNGAIIGSAFVKELNSNDYLSKIAPFIKKIKD